MTKKSGLKAGSLIALCAALCGCVSGSLSTNDPTVSALEIRALQSRSYEGIDSKAAMKALIHVLQDEGYMVEYGDSELGILRATRTTAGVQRFATEPIGTFGHVTLGATANIIGSAQNTTIRVSFREDSELGYGRAAHPILDPRHYQDFFAKLERGIFIQKQGL